MSYIVIAILSYFITRNRVLDLTVRLTLMVIFTFAIVWLINIGFVKELFFAIIGVPVDLVKALFGFAQAIM